MATNYSQVSYGASGNDVKTLQEMLNKNGYSLETDGKYGPKTQDAVKDYQSKKGLTVDGIVGKNTWGALSGGSSGGTSAEEAPKTSAADMKFSYDNYQESDTIKQANALIQQHMANKPGEFSYSNQDQLSAIMDQYMNRDKFSYDLNADALYQQYADQYVTQGKLAMMDTMGQAAAMTGGYGNSYAQTVGQQTYQGYLQQLNEVVPELYGMALDQYNQEGEAMLNQYGLLSSERDQEYGVYRDQVSDYYTELARLTEDARYMSEDEYNKYLNDLNMKYSVFSDEKSYAYQVERDAVADEQWQKQFDETIRQHNASLKEEQRQFNTSLEASKSSGGSGGSGGDGEEPYSMSATEYEKWTNMWANVVDDKGAKALRDNMIHTGVPEDIAFNLYYAWLEDDEEPTNTTVSTGGGGVGGGGVGGKYGFHYVKD